MPTISTVTELMEYADKQLVMAVKGRVKSVYKSEAKNGQYGPYTMQNLTITDGRSDMRVTIYDHDEIPRGAVGKELYLASVQGDKGWTGVSVSIWTNPKDNLTHTQLKVTAKADVNVAGQGQQSAPAPQQRQGQPAPRQQQQQTQQTFPAKSSFDVMKDARMHLGKCAVLMSLCKDAADYLNTKHKEKHGAHMADAQYQAICSTFFISCKDEGFLNGLPTKFPNQEQGVADALQEPPKPAPLPPSQMEEPPDYGPEPGQAQDEPEGEIPF